MKGPWHPFPITPNPATPPIHLTLHYRKDSGCEKLRVIRLTKRYPGSFNDSENKLYSKYSPVTPPFPFPTEVPFP